MTMRLFGWIFLLIIGLNTGCRHLLPAPQHFQTTEQNSGGTARFQAVSVVNDQIVWASGTNGTFARTTDGGKTWQIATVPQATDLEFRDVQGFDAQTAVLMSAGEGDKSRFYRTEDGGKTWQLHFTNPLPGGFYDGIAFWDARRGVAFSDGTEGTFPILRTEDGGKTWMRVSQDRIPKPLAGEGGFAASGTNIIAVAGGTGYIGTGASSQKARVLITRDYGQSWAAADTPMVSDAPTAGITSLVFTDGQNGYAFGGDFQRDDPPANRVIQTQDGGKTWRVLPNPPLRNSIFGAAALPDRKSFLIVGPRGAYTSINGGQSWQALATQNYWSAGCGKHACWMVGTEARITRVSW